MRKLMKHGLDKLEVRLHRQELCIRVAIILAVLVNLCLPGCQRPTATPTPEWWPDAEERIQQEEHYLFDGIGRQAVDLLRLEEIDPGIAAHFETGASYPIPYLAIGGFALDPTWYSNRVRIADLPTQPVDFQQALGVFENPENAPDLKVVYYLGDELVLWSGSKLHFRINENLEIAECLNNPSQRLNNGEDCDIYVKNPTGTKKMLAIERDLYSARFSELDPTRFTSTKFSGTVVFAKKIVLAGEIETGGYDLVLVADEIESWPSASINTTPPKRPFDDGGSGGAHDYGRGKPGYRGGDIVILSRRTVGELKITTQGGQGQPGEDDLPCDNVTEELVGCRIDDYTDIPLNPTDCGYDPATPADDYDVPGLVFDAKYYCIGEAGLGGKGGDGGNVTVIASDMPFEIKELNQQGGSPGSNGEYIGEKPYGPEAVAGINQFGIGVWGDMSLQEAFEKEDEQGHGDIMSCLTGQEMWNYFVDRCDMIGVTSERVLPGYYQACPSPRPHDDPPRIVEPEGGIVRWRCTCYNNYGIWWECHVSDLLDQDYFDNGTFYGGAFDVAL
ncbi:MAG: hypothetical protein FJ014_16335 [Chloroflexi bacterium]|nr:hypothetical protein [Chloroflexota bacterium]